MARSDAASRLTGTRGSAYAACHMTTTRRTSHGLGRCARRAAWRRGAAAAQDGPRGILVSQSATPDVIEPFKKRLGELGWTEGQNLSLEVRSPEGDAGRLPALAAELVRLRVDVLVTFRCASVTGARPGGNVTGLSTLSLGYVKQDA